MTSKEDVTLWDNHPFILQHVSKQHARVAFIFQLAICTWYYYDEYSTAWFYYVFGYIFVAIDFKVGDAAMIPVSSCCDLRYYQKSALIYYLVVYRPQQLISPIMKYACNLNLFVGFIFYVSF